MDIGYKIRKRRKELDLTQVELGQKIHKSSQVISNWERGYTTGIVSEDLHELSMALSVPIDYFIPTHDANTTPQDVPQLDQRLEAIIRVYPNLDEKSKDIIDAIIKLNTGAQK
ncbi:helix-turn-helix domain-containing protein [Anaerovibrio sp.]|uniref:helix-turn-helix domain-containing protein n=1 Tax=Anaerovibrio sp. TaxID=1872532 RepID=UPI00389117CD